MSENDVEIDGPVHVGIIMDGNRRWAAERGLPSLRGHAKGQMVLREIAKYAFNHGVKYLSVYAFSTENWQRSQTEVKYLMRLFGTALRKYLQEFMDNGIKIVFLGSREELDKNVLRVMMDTETATAKNEKATLAVCFNYGGQQEIADATKRIISDGVDPQVITPELISEYLYAPELPPIDLLIRTSGEQRLSNYMLWRAAYSELIFTQTYWPDFTSSEFELMLEEYSQRQRRFGS